MAEEFDYNVWVRKNSKNFTKVTHQLHWLLLLFSAITGGSSKSNGFCARTKTKLLLNLGLVFFFFDFCSVFDVIHGMVAMEIYFLHLYENRIYAHSVFSN